MRRLMAGLAGLLLLTGCVSDAPRSTQPAGEPTRSAPGASDSRAPSPAPRTSPPAVTPEPEPQRPLLGVDVSHHKGVVDWERVRDDGMSFAYLKATEGTGFTDSRFAENLRQARAAGLRAGGYHYFTLCSPGAPQAEHFLSVIGEGTTLPPAVDVELIGNCQPGPTREVLLDELRAFMEVVESRTGRAMVVYLHPDLEERYRLARELDRRQWVRSLGARPSRDWWMWQKSDSAEIDGISSPADLNQMR